MLTLLPELTSFSVKKRAHSITAVHHPSIESSHCSPQTTNTFSPSFIKSLLSLMLVLGLFHETTLRYTPSTGPSTEVSRAYDIITRQNIGNLNQLNGENFIWKTLYDGLGRRIQTSSEGSTINYYYDPEVEFLELGHCVNGVHIWSLYGPDRSGAYGGAQGIGGLESTYNESTGITYDHVKNIFGDTVGIYTDNQAALYASVLGGYGPMPGSSVNGDLYPQWRGHYMDATGFVYMGARYYDPVDGRFLSADPLGHGSSLSLYDYCNGDPVNGLDPDGRCVEKVGAAGIATASFFMGGPGSYTGIDYGTDQLHLTDTSKFSPEELLEYNRNVATLSGAAQDATFALAGAVTPYNQISYEPMRFEIGAGEPAVKLAEVNKTGQMEFRFARGASIQPPDITRTGEAFVRVGATEESTVARSGNYVMPVATFNFFIRAPDLLKDAFDLPGSAPKYYRYIFPPAGTSIQRGIVPGKEFEGNGGYEEGILWY